MWGAAVYALPPQIPRDKCAREYRWLLLYIIHPLNVFWLHDDVINWKHFPRYWPFVRGIHRSPVNSLHKGQWRGALMFSLICAWINGSVNNHEANEWFETLSRALWCHRNGFQGSSAVFSWIKFRLISSKFLTYVRHFRKYFMGEIGWILFEFHFLFRRVKFTALLRVMACSEQATSHYMKQLWSWLLTPTCVTWLSLQWRHNELDGVSNYRRLDCLFDLLFRRRSKTTSKLGVTRLCEGSSSVTDEFPTQRISNTENVSIWWGHHARCVWTCIWRHMYPTKYFQFF